MLTVGLIGPGRAGQALVRLLPPASYEIGTVLARSFTSARRATRRMRLGAPTADYEDFAGCGLILVAVPDDAIRDVAARLASASFSFGRKVVLHTSGALDSSELAVVRTRGAAVGSLHPLQTFGSRVLSLAGIHFAVEGDAAAVRAAHALVAAWQGKLLRIAPGQKPLYHAAATFASPLFVPLMETAVRLMIRAGAPPRTAIHALRPLLATTLENYTQNGKQSWTGPFARGDAATIRKHLEALTRFHPELARYYRACGLTALALFRRHSELKPVLEEEI